MHLRDLKSAHGRGKVWPPSWDGLPDGVWEKAILIAVRRIGKRLSVTARDENNEDIAFLDDWKPPPSIEEVEMTLLSAIGRAIRVIGETDMRHSASPPSDPLGF
jgi:hypothetical protein